MEYYFGKDFPGEPFKHFSIPHIIVLVLLLIVNLSFIYIRKNPNPKTQKNIRYAIASILLINEATWHIWNLTTGQWSIQTMLPLHLCSVFVFLNSFMLITKSYPIFEIAYFLGIAGATQPLLTPDLGLYNFPHFRFFQVFLSHGLIVTSTIYMAVVEGFRPYPKSLLRVLIIGNLYGVIVGIINLLLGSNYLFICRPPDTPSLIDLLGPWPQYLFPLEIITISVCSILYVPYFISDRLRTKRQSYLPNQIYE